MNDRELLELAAKAAGYDIAWFPGWPGGGCYLKTVAPAPADPILSKELPWNALTNDGDALRLAVKLGISIDSYSDTVSADGIHEDRGVDDCASTRRAIVRAAAEIGKTRSD